MGTGQRANRCDRCGGPTRWDYPAGDPENGPMQRWCLDAECQRQQDIAEIEADIASWKDDPTVCSDCGLPLGAAESCLYPGCQDDLHDPPPVETCWDCGNRLDDKGACVLGC